MEQNHVRFVIVGAGISGLQAASILAQKNQSFVILQAQPRIGGRICTLTIGDALKQDGNESNYSWLEAVRGKPVQVGATWICQDHKNMKNLVQKFKVGIHPQFYEGTNILALNQQKLLHLQEYSEFYLQFKDKLIPVIQDMQKLRDRYGYLLQLKRKGGLSPDLEEELRNFYITYDSMTGYQFILKGIKDEYLTRLVSIQIESLQAVSPQHFSALEFIMGDTSWHCIYENLQLTSNNIDGFRAKNGFTTLINAIAANIDALLKKSNPSRTLNTCLKLGCPVAAIHNDRSPVEVVCEKGEVFTCEKVLMSVPAGTIGKIKFSKLSEGKRIIFQNQRNNQTIRMNMIFPTPFWRNTKHSGSVIFSHQYPMREVVELTPEDSSCGILAFVFFKYGYQRWKKEIDEQYMKIQGKEEKEIKYEINKKKALRIIADLFLQGNIESQLLKECIIFTRSLSDIPYIRDTYQSSTIPGTYLKVHELGQDLDLANFDENNLVFLGSDFSEMDQEEGYMQGGVGIANRKVRKLLGQF